MRISNGLTVNTYLRNLDNIQNQKYKNEIRLSTGKNIVNLADAPEKLVRVKNMDFLISDNEKYKYIIDQSIREMQAAEDKLQSISDKIGEIRQLAVDSTHAGAAGNTYSLGVYVRGLLEDIIKEANTDFNGKLLFSGTKSTVDSITPESPQTTNLPFEIVQEQATPDNPSGLKIYFKGNFEDRIINKDSKTTEKINVTANEMFGAGGTEFFENIIKLYNVLSFKSDGTPRQETDPLSKFDVDEINNLQAKLAVTNEQLNKLTAQLSARRNRMENISSQMSEEVIRYKELKTINEDTDYAKVTMDLRLEEIALQYSLQVGSNLLQKSLMDFLR
ncbi:MAG: hypothetical protein WHV28_01675 [Bacteroidota bacterium]